MGGGGHSKSARAARSMGGSLGGSANIPTVTTTSKELTPTLVFAEMQDTSGLKEGEDFGAYFKYAGDFTVKSRTKGPLNLSRNVFVGLSPYKDKNQPTSTP
jgi:hypothetical protein